ncbi:MAG: hypothetical protein U0531_11940 [Dehalococcoidia bacterium]
MRRCTGFSPSRTSGRARETITLIAYSRYEARISSSILMGRIFPPGAWDTIVTFLAQSVTAMLHE